MTTQAQASQVESQLFPDSKALEGSWLAVLGPLAHPSEPCRGHMEEL
jgi:hypothetical protein